MLHYCQKLSFPQAKSIGLILKSQKDSSIGFTRGEMGQLSFFLFYARRVHLGWIFFHVKNRSFTHQYFVWSCLVAFLIAQGILNLLGLLQRTGQEMFLSLWSSHCVCVFPLRRLAYRNKMGTLPNSKSPKKAVCEYLLFTLHILIEMPSILLFRLIDTRLVYTTG